MTFARFVFGLYDAHNLTQWWRDPATVTAIATAVIAVATVVYAIVSLGHWRATKRSAQVAQKILELTHRPYLTVDDSRAEDDPVNRKLSVVFIFKNVGSVPACELTIEWGFYINGQKTGYPIGHIGPATHVLPPQTEEMLTGYVSDGTYSAITSGSSQLEIRFSFKYKGVSHAEYYFDGTAHYSHVLQGFQIVRVDAN
ncbi:MAG: hypothetical protein LAO21_13385 [Acidobacteriia bacterium]|nr:hypothetical protein [Terriglobia bacterium]